MMDTIDASCPNSFEFVVTAGARARQLLAGSTPRVDGRRAQEDHRRAAGSPDRRGREDRVENESRESASRQLERSVDLSQ